MFGDGLLGFCCVGRGLWFGIRDVFVIGGWIAVMLRACVLGWVAVGLLTGVLLRLLCVSLLVFLCVACLWFVCNICACVAGGRFVVLRCLPVVIVLLWFGYC